MYTKEQLSAINESGKNIIVSAGAGSGKTAVLTERVLRLLKSGIHINELLVLTFTNAAASEMKERIRKKIKENKELIDELDLLDSSYITTFDSFALSNVKKYHYLLNLGKDINIIDSNIIIMEKQRLIDTIFEEYYNKEDKRFLKLIKDFCVKDDKDIKKYILEISSKLDLKVDKEDYLNNYLEDKFNNVDNDLKLYEELILNKVRNIYKLIDRINNKDYKDKILDSLSNLINSKNYDDVRVNLNIKLPIVRNDEETKEIKEVISKSITELKDLTLYTLDELKDNFLSTKDYQSIIVDIIKELDNRINKFKYDNDSYEFNDIAKLLIKIIKENPDIKEEIKNKYKEILVDEYQDTSDIQEEFINLIANNNVYMVGDIKQSIYRFRNANPYIFKDKYDRYSNNIDGIKIDLLKNFRSREEVLNNINLLFNEIMTDEIGGADYIKSHNMIFGNNSYIKEGKTDLDYNMEIYEYPNTSEEKECFIICNDIKEKINNKYKIFDKDKKELRDIKYSDFVILMDRASSFDLYKQIFTYNNIPLTIIKEEKMNEDKDLYIIKNIIKLLLKEEIDKEYEYLFMSIERSFLFRLDDNTIYESIINNNYDNEIIDKINSIKKDISNLTPTLLIDKILNVFNYYEKLVTTSNIKASMTRIDKIKEYAANLETLGYSIRDFSDYLEELIENNYDLTYSYNDDNSDSVRIMTIHKSKGLGFPICYFSGLYKRFNIRDLNERFLYDNEYGIITPFFKEGIGNTFYKALMKDNYIKEEISEKIRLFYVALTRAKEKMIFIDNNKKATKLSPIYFKSFKDILDYLDLEKYNKEIDVEVPDYKVINNKDLYSKIPTNDEKINEINISVDKTLLNESTYSKHQDIIDESIKNNMEYGKKVHEIFELEDFKNTDNELVLRLKKHFDIENANIIKEYEFIYEDTEIHHGIIDLMLEYNDHIDLIDYKLKNVEDPAYINQLNGYKKYIEELSKKKVNIYLYSILSDEVKSI